MTVLEVIGLEKEYTNRSGGSTVRALRGVNFAVDAGEYVAIMGESGSGKTTLLNILASLDEPTGGRVLLDGKDLADVSERELAAFRRDNLGFVFQDFNLLDTFSVRDNILLPLVLGGVSLDEMEQRLGSVTASLGIDGLLSKFPYELSVDAASHAGRILFIRDGVLFHQIYRGDSTNEQLYQKISDTLTMLRSGGDAE